MIDQLVVGGEGKSGIRETSSVFVLITRQSHFLSMEAWESMDSVRGGAGTRTFSFGHVSFRIPIRDVKLEVEGVLVECRRELWAGDVNVGAIGKQMMLAFIGLHQCYSKWGPQIAATWMDLDDCYTK